MRILAVCLIAVILLSGCKETEDNVSGALALREKITTADACLFDAVITADYGDVLHTFSVNCNYEKSGKLQFSVSSPESIAGITGYFDGNGGNLTFADQVLAFPLLAEGQLSPVSAPWLLLKTLKGGYLISCGEDGQYFRICIDESYEEKVLRADIWTDQDYIPVRCDFLWDGKRILSMEIENFSCM